MSSELSCQQDVLVRGLFAFQAQDDMRTRDILGMQPEIVEAGCLEGELVVLIVVFAYEDIMTVRCAETERTGWLVLGLFLELFMQIAAGDELGPDLCDFGQCREACREASMLAR